MTEAEILTVRNDLTEIVLSVFSVSFAMISSYLAGLWFFLKHAPFTLRALAFVILSVGLAFMGTLTAGINDLMMGTEKAWSRLGQPATGITGFGSETPAYLMGLSLYEAATVLGGLAFLTIYLALAYLTFFYSWPADRRP